MYISPELIKYGVFRLKQLSKTRIPNYELPADSFLEEAVRDILESSINENYNPH